MFDFPCITQLRNYTVQQNALIVNLGNLLLHITLSYMFPLISAIIVRLTYQGKHARRNKYTCSQLIHVKDTAASSVCTVQIVTKSSRMKHLTSACSFTIIHICTIFFFFVTWTINFHMVNEIPTNAFNNICYFINTFLHVSAP
jgi:hypothetical protein